MAVTEFENSANLDDTPKVKNDDAEDKLFLSDEGYFDIC